jgi:hypothetical protein
MRNPNKGIDPRDPEYDDRYADIPADEWEDAAVWEAEQRLEEMENRR